MISNDIILILKDKKLWEKKNQARLVDFIKNTSTPIDNRTNVDFLQDTLRELSQEGLLNELTFNALLSYPQQQRRMVYFLSTRPGLSLMVKTLMMSCPFLLDDEVLFNRFMDYVENVLSRLKKDEGLANALCHLNDKGILNPSTFEAITSSTHRAFRYRSKGIVNFHNMNLLNQETMNFVSSIDFNDRYNDIFKLLHKNKIMNAAIILDPRLHQRLEPLFVTELEVLGELGFLNADNYNYILNDNDVISYVRHFIPDLLLSESQWMDITARHAQLNQPVFSTFSDGSVYQINQANRTFRRDPYHIVKEILALRAFMFQHDCNHQTLQYQMVDSTIFDSKSQMIKFISQIINPTLLKNTKKDKIKKVKSDLVNEALFKKLFALNESSFLGDVLSELVQIDKLNFFLSDIKLINMMLDHPKPIYFVLVVCLIDDVPGLLNANHLQALSETKTHLRGVYEFLGKLKQAHLLNDYNLQTLFAFAPVLSSEYGFGMLRRFNDLPPHLWTQNLWNNLMELCLQEGDVQMRRRSIDQYLYQLINPAPAVGQQVMGSLNYAQNTHSASTHLSTDITIFRMAIQKTNDEEINSFINELIVFIREKLEYFKNNSETLAYHQMQKGYLGFVRVMNSRDSLILTLDRMKDMLGFMDRKSAENEPVFEPSVIGKLRTTTQLELVVNRGGLRMTLSVFAARLMFDIIKSKPAEVAKETLMEALIGAFYECQRGGNFSQSGEDLILESRDLPICPSGTANKFCEKLSSLSPNILFYHVSEESVTLKIKTLFLHGVKQKIDVLRGNGQHDVANQYIQALKEDSSANAFFTQCWVEQEFKLRADIFRDFDLFYSQNKLAGFITNFYHGILPDTSSPTSIESVHYFNSDFLEWFGQQEALVIEQTTMVSDAPQGFFFSTAVDEYKEGMDDEQVSKRVKR
jgi:hypothetical protein